MGVCRCSTRQLDIYAPGFGPFCGSETNYGCEGEGRIVAVGWGGGGLWLVERMEGGSILKAS